MNTEDVIARYHSRARSVVCPLTESEWADFRRLDPVGAEYAARPARARTDLERQRAKRARDRDLEHRIPETADANRRESCRLDLVKFGITYGGWFIQRPPSERMMKFIRKTEETVIVGGKTHVRWPRGKGKSTWLKIAMLWAFAYGHRRFAVVIAATQALADSITAEIWRAVEYSDRIREDFPELSIPVAALESNAQRAKYQTFKGEATFISINSSLHLYRFARIPGRTKGPIMAGRGVGSAVRGLNIDGIRPDFVFIDDPQTKEDATSKTTVDKIEEYIVGDVLPLAGLDEDGKNVNISAVMASTSIAPDDVSERFADAKRHPEWITDTQPLVIRWPKRKQFIDEYLGEVRKDYAKKDQSLEGSRAWYAERQVEIEEGVVMLDEADGTALEVSAFHHALNLIASIGRKAFDAEFQMKPNLGDSALKLNPHEIMAHVTGVPAYVVPSWCSRGCVAFCDVNVDAGMRWGILAVGPGRATSLIGYGRYPKTGRLFPEGTPQTKWGEHVGKAVLAVANIIGKLPLRDAEGKPTRVRSLCFDGGFEQTAVAGACKRINRFYGFPVGWAKGFNWKTFNPFKAPADKRGEYCFISSSPDGDFLDVHADYWREQMQSSFFAKPGEPGSCAFSGESKDAHYEFACEIANEEMKLKFTRPDGRTQWEWKKSGPNHYGDVLSGCFAVASICGLYDSTGDEVAAALDEAAPELAASKAHGAQNVARRKSRYVLKHK